MYSAGGTVCFDSPSLWSEMSANIELWDPQCSGDVPTEYLRIAPHYPKDLNPTPPPRACVNVYACCWYHRVLLHVLV